MKKNVRALLAATLGCALTLPVLAADPAPAATPAAAPAAEKTSAEPKAVLRQHHDALNKQDLKALMALYADNPNVALMGTGPGEFWKGKAAIEETYKHFFETFKAGSLTHDCPEATGGEEGNDAWLMASCVMKDQDPSGEAREFELNVSAVLKKEKAGWRVQALHTSNLADDAGPPSEEDAVPATAPAPAATPATPVPEAAPKKAP